MFIRALNKDRCTAAKLRYDIHSHLVPGLDDGVQNLDEALSSIQGLIDLGYKGTVTTPHIYPEVFNNTEEDIRGGFKKLCDLSSQRFPDFRLVLGAEYYLDDYLVKKVREDSLNLLTFGNKRQLILVELPFLNTAVNIEELLFACRLRNIQPVIAHIERYDYIQKDRGFALLKIWKEHGALLQLNLGSVIGQYGPAAEETGNAILKQGLYHFIGTDLHRPSQLERFFHRAWRYLEKTLANFNEEMHHQLISD